MMDSRWRIELLGGLGARLGDRVITRFRTRKTGALLGYLAYHGNRMHPREALIELLWPESEPESGRNRLSIALSSLRSQLESPGVPADTVILADRLLVGLNPAMVTTDVAEFEAAFQAAEQEADVFRQRQHLYRAVELYQGELLHGYYEDWILPEQERLAALFSQALHQLVVHLERAGEIQRALEYARGQRPLTRCARKPVAI